MAVPKRLMSALNGLKNITLMDIQLLGQHERLVHYAVGSKTGDEHKVAAFNVTVDYAKEQINVENPSKQLIFISNGGLNRAEDMMSVYSALNYFRSPMLTVCGNQLLDKTEDNSLLQQKIFYHEAKDGFFIIENKNLQRQRSPIVSINQQRRTSSIIINFNYQNPADLSPSKKALALMATLKLMHYHYSFHLHLMPSGIPHLMPPGTPEEPLGVLKFAKEIFMRPSCIIGGGKTMCTDLLDGKKLETLLVVEHDQRNAEQNVLDIRIRDQFGVLQFSAKLDKLQLEMEVYDSKNNNFATYCGKPRAYRLWDEKKMYLKSKQPYRSNHHPDFNVYEVHRSDNRAVLAHFYLMNEWHVVKLSMDSKISVHWKAVIVAHSSALALFILKLWSGTNKQFASEYFFRRT